MPGIERPEEEILVTPEYAILEFGDGYIALIRGAIKQVLEDGRKVIRFMIEPSNLLRKRYRIGDNQLNQNRQMPFIAETNDLIPINILDDANRKWLYIKTFNHDETELSNLGQNLRKQLSESQKRVVMLEGEILWLSEQLQLAKTNPQEFAAQGWEMFEKYGSKILELTKGKKEKEDIE